MAVTTTGAAESEGAGPTAAYGEVKGLLRDAAAGADLRAVLEREAAVQERLGATRDHRAAVRSFLAKEKPSFEGH
ncbi:hypothetical protein [Streptomyces sp. NPDC048496]|uniref:hypothetical protein n=1 Tax=Streptomyces sp. NPDC048496 TaxID=3365558 RepID=UPI003722084D